MKQSVFYLSILLGTLLSHKAQVLFETQGSRLAHASDQRLSITGSSTLAPLASEIAQRFEKHNANLRIDVQTGGSSRGIADARRGLADIGMSSRPLYAEEKIGISTHRIAMDGVTFVTHITNPIDNLTKEQILQIYTGGITNWKHVGGADAPITVIGRAKGRSEVDLVTSFLGITAREIRAGIVAGENQQCIKLISGNKNAIVYLSIGTAEFESKRGAPVKLLALDGIEASSQAVKIGKFPIVRPLVLVSKNHPSAEAQAFLAYALSAEVHDLIQGQAFVPVQ